MKGDLCMQQIQGYFSYIEGTRYEAGYQQGEFAKKHSHFLQGILLNEPLPEDQWKEAAALLEQYCPGITEEIDGFCAALEVPPSLVSYYASSALHSGCSHCAILPAKTENRHTYMLRNYDLSPNVDDMRLCSTSIEKAYKHTGFSVFLFGRTEGMNEHGLCVTFSACGMPVGNAPGMRPPRASGLQFWAVVRALLEQCRNVSEALQLVKEMPIASNMNLIICDPHGHAALVETFDGHKAIREVGDTSQAPYIAATNHPLFADIEQLEPGKLNHSVIRQHILQQFLEQPGSVSIEDLQSLVSTEYPQGLAVHNYNQWFGTLRSMLFDLDDRTINICFGSPIDNPWYTVPVGGKMPVDQVQVTVRHHDYAPDFWQIK